MSNLRLSFIVPVYNRPDEVEELLSSLKTQTDPDFELILVEDGSDSDSKHVVEKYNVDLRIHYFYKENAGPSIARNYGIERASGDYFLFVDSDCILPSHYVAEVRRYLTDHPDVQAFGGPDMADKSFNTLQKSISYSLTSFLTTGGIRGGKKQVDKFHPRSFNLGFSRKVYEQMGGFPDTRLHPGEDMILAIEIIRGGFQTALISEAYVYHKRRTSLRQYKRQVYRFGFVRIVISAMYPDTFKPFFLIPTAFTAGFILAVLGAILGEEWMLGPYLIYFFLVFLDATVKNSSPVVGLLSMVTTAIQMYGYGTGVAFSLWKRWTMKEVKYLEWAETYRG